MGGHNRAHAERRPSSSTADMLVRDDTVRITRRSSSDGVKSAGREDAPFRPARDDVRERDTEASLDRYGRVVGRNGESLDAAAGDVECFDAVQASERQLDRDAIAELEPAEHVWTRGRVFERDAVFDAGELGDAKAGAEIEPAPSSCAAAGAPAASVPITPIIKQTNVERSMRRLRRQGTKSSSKIASVRVASTVDTATIV